MAGLFEKRQLTSSDDFNNIVEFGYYYSHYSSKPNNAPSGWPGSGMLKVDKYGKGTSSIIVQTIINETDGFMYVRTKWSSLAFGNWFQITTSIVE